MSRIAFVTSPQYPQLPADDRLGILELERVGINVVAAVWSDPTVDWAGFDLIILRAMWDYHLHVDAFFRWLQKLETLSTPVWNPVPLARWNADKRYLRDLSERGVAIVPTIWFERGAQPPLRDVMHAKGWTEVVIKPVISSTAYRTIRVRLEEAGACEPELHALLDERAAMVQQFQPAVLVEGEWSIIFMGGTHSHTVSKNAVSGDFRVQEEYGGTTRLAQASAQAMDMAQRAIAACGLEWLYARVDGVESDRGFLVMELEMLEPGLFLLNDPGAPRRFARVIREKLARR